MKKVNSQNLSAVDAMLGITGVGAQQTEFEDGILQQVVNVVPAARRGGTLGPTRGIFFAHLQNVHTDAESLTSTAFPFSITTGRVGAYPSPLRADLFDLWLIQASVRRLSGTGTLICQLMLDLTTGFLGWGLDDSAAAVTGIYRATLGLWDSILAGPGSAVGLLESGDTVLKINQRLTLGCSLRFASTSSLTSTYNCELLFGLFPAASGQDVAF